MRGGRRETVRDGIGKIWRDQVMELCTFIYALYTHIILYTHTIVYIIYYALYTVYIYI